MTNNKLNFVVVGEGDAEEMLGARMPMRFDVPIEMIRSLKSHGDAFTLACNASGMSDKEIFDDESLQIDQGQFSKMKSGQVGIHPSVEAAFCKVVGNKIYPEWKAYQMGCTLVVIESEDERELRLVRQELEVERSKNKVLTDAIQGRVS